MEIHQPKTAARVLVSDLQVWNFRFLLSFEFVSDFGFRISDFET